MWQEQASPYVACYPPGKTVGRRDRPRIGAVCPFVRLVSGGGDHATAHKLARLVYSLLQHGSAYVQQGLEAYEAQYRERKVTVMAKQAKALGYTLVPLAAQG
jgi:hypothetical protein